MTVFQFLRSTTLRLLYFIVLLAMLVQAGWSRAQEPAAEHRLSVVTAEAPGVLAQIQTTQALVLDQLAVRSQQQTEALRAVQAMVIEGQRKSIDLWFAALALLTAMIAIAGGVLPFLLTRKDKQLLRAELVGAKEDRAEMRRRLAEARDLVTTIKSHEQTALRAVDVLEKFDWTEFRERRDSADLADKARTVEEDPASSKHDRLRARAVKVSLIPDPTLEQAQKAFRLWDALVVLDADDASAWFNAAYSAQDLYGRNANPGATHWAEVAKRYYARALQIKPDKPGAARNWAWILADQARTAARESNPEALERARDLWRQASERYAQALEIKPGMHQAASDWSMALLEEAEAVASIDPATVPMLQQRARNVLRTCGSHGTQAAEAVAYSLSRVYALLNEVQPAVQALEQSRAAGLLPADWREDQALDAIRQEPAFQAWSQANFG